MKLDKRRWVPKIVKTDVEGVNPPVLRYLEARNELLRQGVEPAEALRLTQDARNVAAMEFYNLAKRIAKQNTYWIPSVQVEDVVSFAMIGVLMAVERFDPGRGVKILTFASIYIRFALHNHSRSWQFAPKYAIEDAHTLDNEVEAVRQSVQREPSIDEIATHLNAPIAEVSKRVTRARRAYAKKHPSSSFSEDEQKAISVPTRTDPEPQFGATDEESQHLAEVLERAGDRNFEILWMRYAEEKTLDAIGARFGLSRERVRQICARYVKGRKAS